MKKRWFVFFMLFLIPTVFASQQKKEDRSVLAAIGHLEGRGFSNMLLFPAEWPLLAKQEYRNHPRAFAITYLPTLLTHLGGRLFSGITDAVFLPFVYPFSHYDDSLPVGMGWGEFPWQEGTN